MLMAYFTKIQRCGRDLTIAFNVVRKTPKQVLYIIGSVMSNTAKRSESQICPSTETIGGGICAPGHSHLSICFSGFFLALEIAARSAVP